MSEALQQRTTYLISLTLVKVEAVEEENAGEVQEKEKREVGGVETAIRPSEAPAQSGQGSDRVSSATSPTSGDPDSRRLRVEEEDDAWVVHKSTPGREESELETGRTSVQPPKVPVRSSAVKNAELVDLDLWEPEEEEDGQEVLRSKVGTGGTSDRPLEAPVQSNELKDGSRAFKDGPPCILLQTSSETVDPDLRKLEDPVQSSEVKDGGETFKDGPWSDASGLERAASPKSVDPDLKTKKEDAWERSNP
ncbi:uncharacterized protein LOC144072462 [Stigmatopora argus]